MERANNVFHIDSQPGIANLGALIQGTPEHNTAQRKALNTIQQLDEEINGFRQDGVPYTRHNDEQMSNKMLDNEKLMQPYELDLIMNNNQ